MWLWWDALAMLTASDMKMPLPGSLRLRAGAILRLEGIRNYRIRVNRSTYADMVKRGASSDRRPLMWSTRSCSMRNSSSLPIALV